MTTAAVTRITPKMAEKWLEKNTVNRPFSEGVCVTYSETMKRGEWRVNGESIKIGKSGRLIDGQHRLSAVIRSNQSIPMLVVHDVDDDVFDTLDTGKKRGGSDALAIAGHANVAALASAARWGMVILGTCRRNRAVTNHQLIQFVKDNPDLETWVSDYASMKQIRKLLPSGCVAAFYLAAHKHGNEPMQDFMSRLESGLDIGKGSPIYELRERMISSRTTRTSAMRVEAAVAMTIKAINAYIEGKKVGVLRWGSEEEFPRIVGY